MKCKFRAELKIPKGYELVKRPNFVDRSFVLVCDILSDDLFWKDTTLELDDDESSLSIYIEKK